MELKTLEELNRVFMADSQTHEQKTKFEPITPLIIEMELPKTMQPQETKRYKLKYSKAYEPQIKSKRSKKGRELFTAISDMLFSLAIVIILFTVLISGTDSGVPKSIFNYYYFTVVSPSMQDEIPQGSFILVKQVDPLELKKGDNITYRVDRSATVTHKIVDIYENYDNSGARGFQTKGVNNLSSDRNIIYEANVVGKVILVLPFFGTVLSQLSENIFLIFIIFGLCVLLSFLLRGVSTKPTKRHSP